MRIPQRGSKPDDILQRLGAFKKSDAPWRSGSVLAFVWGASEQGAALAERAHQMYLWENAVEPTVFPSALELETQIVEMARCHLGGDDQVCGNFTSGGTESVLLAVKTARDWARANRPGRSRVQMVLPVTAHPCFFKAAQYFGVEPVVVPVNPETYRADVAAMAAAITDDTALLVGSATSYAHGVTDPIPEIAALAKSRDLLCHVDGCIGGFLLPFFRELGAPVTPFDFSVPGVTSISMDLHKYAYAPTGASVVLYKNAELRRHQIFCHSAWPGYSVINPTMQSSKSCGPMAAAWATLQFYGMDSYRSLAKGLLDDHKRVVQGINDIPELRVLGQPEMPLIAVGSKKISVFRLCDEVKKRGYVVHPQLSVGTLEPSLHIMLVPLNERRIDGFLTALREAAREVTATSGAAGSMEPVRMAMKSVDLTKIDDRGIEMLLEVAGLGAGQLPGDDIGEVWQILNELDGPLKDRVLTLYYNKLNRYRECMS